MSKGQADTRDELFETIDREATSTEENRDSKEIYDALRARREHLSGSSHLPANDQALTDSIREAASQRSRELSRESARAVAAASSVLQSARNEQPVPTWLWVAWAVAIAAAAAGLYFLW